MRLRGPLLRGRLIRRYKRFLADVRLESGELVVAHCPDPGAMTGLAVAGAEVIVSERAGPRRKLRYTWELVRPERSWVTVDAARANDVVAEALERARVAELVGCDQVRREVACGRASRLDFQMRCGGRVTWLEVKSVTLRVGKVAMFPDAVTVRGRRHVELLAQRVRRGERAILLFLVGRGDCVSFRPAAQIDPAYARALCQAVRAGVEVLVYRARVRAD